jgi:hypothetical protein
MIIGGIITMVVVQAYLIMEKSVYKGKPVLGWKEYRNKEHSFSLEYPHGWRVKEDLPTGNTVAFVGPHEKGQITIVVSITRLDINVSLETLVENDIRTLSERDKTFEVLGKEEIEVNGRDGRIIKAKFRIGDEITKMVYLTLKCGDYRAITIGGGANINHFSKYEPLFLHTIYSVKC